MTGEPDGPAWQARHDLASAAGEPGYFDPATGLFVMTEHYLRARGTCCSNRCRHCPYGDAEPDEVPGDSAD